MAHSHAVLSRRRAAALAAAAPVLALAAACGDDTPSPTGTASGQAVQEASAGTSSAVTPDLDAEREDPQLVPSPAPTDGETFEAAADVHLTVPSALTHTTTKDGQTRWLYYVSDEDCGMLDVVAAPFFWGTAAEEADDQWQAYVDDTDSASALVQVEWPGAADAWSWTWEQVADRAVFDGSLSGVVNVSGVSVILTTEGGQDLRVTAYAPAGALEGSAAVAAMQSLVLG
ncbi:MULTISPECIES: hypothetical protein [unclassified Actinomyces]|uniref:hypothetical protein n=1 Tax=unclassified Actinomyces TaxID=2609248 RepID=UPI0020177C74|nr:MULTISPECIES: hypothetical protein [unclassified Actinomyces]MCL3777082.1 hypothetical protein [Actinomyces sp. AC-20-1]MCL3789906.1 hypothetical protein [Actinomyces sp. 187325]MCL3792992.1 hypothetical protein [Actinomyces sp. 186855]MCL3795408.1 hypothetical protein [Actinomyces sp. 217892]